MSMHIAPAQRVLFACSLAWAPAGCGSGSDKWKQGRPPVYPTTGSVKLDGQPLSGATVTFQPLDATTGRAGSAITDASGMFHVQSFDPGDGLTAGKHRVAIQKVTLVDPEGKEVLEVREPGGLKEVNFVPDKFRAFDSSGLEVEIKAVKKNELPAFELTSK